MKAAYAVIGAHYGDEGKGQVTAWLCRRLKEEHPDAKVLNVLTNGGCQRGHTVHISGDKDFRHVFKHFGSGTPYGAHTHFGPEFILNPMEFVHEDEELSKAGFRPVCSCSWHNRVQLPVDIAVNQYLEKARAGRSMEHGSVGFGINETILRYERGMGMSFIDMVTNAEDDDVAFEKRLVELSHDYAHGRFMEEFGEEITFDDFTSKYHDFLCPGTMRHYIDDLRRTADRIDMTYAAGVSYSHDFFVFENGQGLKIGQQASKNFFNCTPSDTGAFSVLRAMYDMKLIGDGATDHTKVDRLVPVYVTRTYMTRHGAGPFSSKETDVPPFGERPDATNKPNDFQGRIRYAEFSGKADFDPMYEDVERFRKTCEGQCVLKPKIALTHYCWSGLMTNKVTPWYADFLFRNDEPEAMLADGKTDIF